MKKFVLIAFFLTFNAFAQDCSCEENFLWVKKTFEENDAGFQVALDRKGKAEYEKHNQIYLEKVRKIEDINECGRTLYDWLTFFRNGHISIDIHQENVNNTPIATTNTDTKNWETVSMTEKQIQKYMSGIKQNSFEGIWKMDSYTIGVIKKEDGYVGFIIDAPGTGWQKNQVKIRLHPNENKTGYAGKLYLRNYSEYPLDKVSLIGNNYTKLGQFAFHRVNPVIADSDAVKSYLELMKTREPIMQEYSKNTLVLRIPSFAWEEKGAIDSLLTVYHEKIISTPNLVIDIRGNGGGADRSYNKIIPYLYTNPIRTVGLEMLSTPLNNQRMEGFLEMSDVSDEEKKEIREDLVYMNNNLGKFVNLLGQKVFIQTEDTIHNYPKNVAILINGNNGSTAEQFLLAAKQSSKTKLFGTTTMGVLDISNMHFVKSPCGKIELGYCLSKSYRIPEMAIDGKGIQPDYYMDDTISDYEWVEFAEETFQKKK